MNIAILGGRGFVGSKMTEQLREQGHEVTTMDPHVGGDQHISVSILADDLTEHLDGYDTVINLVGLSPVKKPRGSHGYYDIHVAGAENVAAACEENNIPNLVHMSAIGADPAADHVVSRTKGLGEEAVQSADIENVTIFRPSIIFDEENELVDAAQTFAPTRMFPNIPMKIQPIYREDVAELFVKAAENEISEDVLEIAGPEQMTLFEFVQHIYNANNYRCIALPLTTVLTYGMHLIKYVPFAPVGADQAQALKLDNTTDNNSAPEYIDPTSYSNWVTNVF